MPDEPAPDGIDGLQFDHAVTESGSPNGPDTRGVVCAGCKRSIDTEYYDVNGNFFCGRCRDAVERWAETPQGAGPLARAALFGFGAALAGAAIYFAVLAIAHLQIGLIAILSGYMIGRAVRIGARNRGGLRFQILAATLTYMSVGMAYAPLAISQSARSEVQQPATTSTAAPARTPVRGDAAPVRISRLTATGLLIAFVFALPILVIISSLPSGLISALIIAIGIRQAWQMTRAPWIQVLGPYRVGTGAAAPSA